MSSRLVVCSSCDRHVLANETKCPFCESTLLRRLVVGMAGLALMGCPDKQLKAEPDAASASASADPAASASASAVASGSIDAGDFGGLAVGGDLRVGDGGLGISGLRQTGGVYGPAPNNRNTGLGGLDAFRGECSMTPSTATVPVTNADRVLAGVRPRIRASYNQALQNDASIKGTFKFNAKIAADGSVSDVEGSGPGLPESVVNAMKSHLKRLQFDAPGKPSVISGSFVCKPAD